MRKFKLNKMWIPAILLAVVTVGCSDADKGGGSAGSQFTTPTVLGPSVLPPIGSSGICPNAVVTAIFSKAMNPATINTTTFTLTAPSGSVSGAVTFDPASNTATFTPANPPGLALNTTFTATITTGAQDQFGNGLAANFTWTFTTSAVACSSPVPLLTAGGFRVLGGSTVTNTALITTITGGDLGLSPGTSVTGFPPGIVVAPGVMHVTDPIAAQAQLDLTAAYNFAKGLPSTGVLAGDLMGLTLAPGVYTTGSSTMISAGSVTLMGTATDVFVFQIGSTLTTSPGTSVILSGGVVPDNVFWQVGSSATIGTTSNFSGTIMAFTAITLDTNAVLHGRALARNAAVTLDGNMIGP